MWSILFFGRLTHCKPCGWYYNLRSKRIKKGSVISALETSSSLLFGWFNNNFMKANSDKNHLIILQWLTVCPLIPAKTEVLPGITIDHELKFDNQVNNLCKKLNALAGIAPFMNVSQKRIILKSIIESQFGYCPLI